MMIEQRIDALITAGWSMFENSFTVTAFQEWRRQALAVMTALVGKDHPYTVYLEGKMQPGSRGSLLIAIGLLTAVGGNPCLQQQRDKVH